MRRLLKRLVELVWRCRRHSGQAGDSAGGRISLRLKLARPGIQENQKLLDTRFRGYDGGGLLIYFANFSSRTLVQYYIKWIRSRFLACSRLQRCWCAIRSRIAVGGLFLASPSHALWDPFTDFSRALGPLDWWRLSGVLSRCDGGGCDRTRPFNPRRS